MIDITDIRTAARSVQTSLRSIGNADELNSVLSISRSLSSLPNDIQAAIESYLTNYVSVQTFDATGVETTNSDRSKLAAMAFENIRQMLQNVLDRRFDKTSISLQAATLEIEYIDKITNKVAYIEILSPGDGNGDQTIIRLQPTPSSNPATIRVESILVEVNNGRRQIKSRRTVQFYDISSAGVPGYYTNIDISLARRLINLSTRVNGDALTLEIKYIGKEHVNYTNRVRNITVLYFNPNDVVEYTIDAATLTDLTVHDVEASPYPYTQVPLSYRSNINEYDHVGGKEYLDNSRFSLGTGSLLYASTTARGHSLADNILRLINTLPNI